MTRLCPAGPQADRAGANHADASPRWAFLAVRAIFVALLVCLPLSADERSGGVTNARPNIVVILADDLGYGDLRCYNGESKIETAALDRLASEGMRFTDAHSPGAVCIPTRYGLLTGRYPHRAQFKGGPLLEEGRLTLPAMLGHAGYHTACIGKWHLGFQGTHPRRMEERLLGGPLDRGFDRFFGLHASLDIPPYYYIDGRNAVAPPTETVGASRTEGWSPIQGAFWREGNIAPGFRHERVLPDIFDHCQAYLRERAAVPGRPFFLYASLTAPHTPWLPAEEFRGKSGAGMYGDFVLQVDDGIGELLRTLDELNLSDKTLVIFSSDNGPVWYPHDTTRFAHSSTGPLRGMKGDAWEGGHRMPLIIRWPGKVPAASRCDRLVCQTDLFATFAQMLGAEIPANAAETSVSFLSLLEDPQRPAARDSFVLRSSRGLFTVRDSRWKLIDGQGSGGFSRYKPSRQEPVGQLYDLRADLGEQRNVYREHPQIVKRLQGLLAAERADVRSTRSKQVP